METIRISDSVNIDLAPDGTVYGIELLNANEQLRAGDAGKLIVINEASAIVKKCLLANQGDHRRALGLSVLGNAARRQSDCDVACDVSLSKYPLFR